MTSPRSEEFDECVLTTVVNGRIEVVLGQLDRGRLCAGHGTGSDSNGQENSRVV